MNVMIKKLKILFVCCLFIILYKGVDVYAEENIDTKGEEGMEQGLVYDGLNYYDSISEALDKNNSSEISLVLMEDDTIDRTFTIAENRNVTIDLNGNELCIGTTNGVGITNNGSLRIDDSLGEGSIDSYISVFPNSGDSPVPIIRTICIDNYSVVTLKNIKISSNVFISSNQYGRLEYKFLYNHENSMANIDNVAIVGEHNASSMSILDIDYVVMNDFFLYNESSNVNIKGMTYSISSKNTNRSKSPNKTIGGNVVYQKGGNISCDNLIITDRFIDKGICVCNNSDVEIVNSVIKATTVGLEVNTGSSVALDDTSIYSTVYGVKNSASIIKINKSNIMVSGGEKTIIGIDNSNEGNIEIGKDPDNTVDNMKIEVAGYGSEYVYAYGIRSDGELYIPRAFIYVHAANDNIGISYSGSGDLVVGNTIDGNNDTLQIIAGNPGTNSYALCVESNANVTKLLSGIYYSANTHVYTVCSSDLIIGNSEISPTTGNPIIYNSSMVAINAENSGVYYYSGFVSEGIRAANIHLPSHYSMEYDYDTDGEKYCYLDIEKHDLIIHANGGQTTVGNIKVPYDHYIETYLDDDSIALSREGYTFVEWTLDEAGEKKISSIKMEEKDIDIYAQWKMNIENPNNPDKPDRPGEQNKPSEKKDDLKENDMVQDSVNKCKVQVTSTNPANRTVTYMGCIDQNAKKIKIPNEIMIYGDKYKITEIAEAAFKNNKKVESVSIGNNIKIIGENAFQGCKKLKTIIIGKNITTIERNAFYNCAALTRITIPSKVKVIGKNAFYGCKKLKSITIKTTKLKTKNVGKNAFMNINKKAIVKVPAKKVSEYKKLLKKRGIAGKNQKIKK